MEKKLLILVAPPYANNKLHIAHIRSTYLPADILARYSRMAGREVCFVGGADEYGLPVLLEAEKTGMNINNIINTYYLSHVEDFEKLDISFDIFSRTTSRHHKDMVYSFYEASKNGDRIYSKEVLTPYCDNCTHFLSDRYLIGQCPYCATEAEGDHCNGCGKHLEFHEIVNPVCKKCGKKPTFYSDEHIFYRISDKHKEILDEILAKNLMPVDVKETANAVTSFVDWDITRYYSWGIPIPDRDKKIFYMIFEAFPNYVTFTADLEDQVGKNGFASSIWHENSKWEHIYFMGRDLVFLHISIWQLMLKNMHFKRPDVINGGGLLNISGKKMSKSKGWMITVKDFLKSFDADFLRYYLARFAAFRDDAEFDWMQFNEIVYDEFLALPKYMADILTEVQESNRHSLDDLANLFTQVGEFIDDCRFERSLEQITKFYSTVASNGVSLVDKGCFVASMPILLFPFVPKTAMRLWNSLGFDENLCDQPWSPKRMSLTSKPVMETIEGIRNSFPIIDPNDVHVFLALLPQIKMESKSCFLATQAKSMLNKE